MVNRLAVIATPLLSAVLAVPVATGIASAAPVNGRVAVSVALEAPPDAAARTWRFELVDASGDVASSISIPLSGEAPRAVAAIEDVPSGDYVLRPVFSSDLGSDCASGAHYRVNSEAAPVPVRPSGAGASFTISVCDSAIASAGAIPVSVHTNELREVGEPSSMLPIGSGQETHGTRNLAVLFGGLALLATGFAWMRTRSLRS